ncbi:MAG: NAD(P)-dependent oxidoreductase [Thermoanaerobaculaceae bacterium]|nr:NAD(P)-dependent oxidoreductase [Thermoanaerobaculaceae bacterium]
MSLPRIIVTGASGFVGRHLLEEIKERYRILGLGRRSQRDCGAPVHPNIAWSQVDIGEREPLARALESVAATGGADVLLHLAAHYDFTGEENPEYWRTNVEGLRNVLELAKGLKLRRFVFASSVAACRFPPPGGALDERSVPDGDHIYARTKRIGEEMVREYAAHFPTSTVRFAALFSDWCEYPPLYVFLETWLSQRWNARVLGGRGASAVPYLHVRDAVRALSVLLRRPELPDEGEVFAISPDRAVSHRDLFAAARMSAFGQRTRPICVPRVLCGPGMQARDLLGRALGERPFERPWMARYIDLAMTVNAARTRERLAWAPRPRLEVLRRLPFVLENRKTQPAEWSSVNLAAMKMVNIRPNLRIHRLLEAHEEQIRAAMTDQLLTPEPHRRHPKFEQLPRHEHDWYNRLLLHGLMDSIRARDKTLFRAHCRDLAERRRAQGFTADEVSFALRLFNEICIKTLSLEPSAVSLRELDDYITAAVQFGIDEVEDVFDQDGGER